MPYKGSTTGSMQSAPCCPKCNDSTESVSSISPGEPVYQASRINFSCKIVCRFIYILKTVDTKTFLFLYLPLSLKWNKIFSMVKKTIGSNFQGIIERDISVIRKETEIASLSSELTNIKSELNAARKTIFSLQVFLLRHAFISTQSKFLIRCVLVWCF